MRGIFTIAGLLVALVIVGLLAKKQLSAGVAPVAVPNGAGTTMAAPTGTPKQQVQQFKNAVEGAMQQSRPVADDVK
jgi:hypothetical protein